MAYVTRIGCNPEQVEYRLDGGHGCASDRQFSYHADGGERPLVWTGAGLPEVDIQPGTRLTAEDMDKARALMAGLDPRTGEVLVEAKRAVYEDAKVPLTPLVAAVQARAETRGVAAHELLAGSGGKWVKAYARAERAVAAKGEGARLRADEAGAIADAAGVDVAGVWGDAAYQEAVANLTEVRTVTDPDGSARAQIVPRRRLVGNAGYDVTFTLPKSMSLLMAFADEDTAMALEQRYQARISDTFDWLEAQTAYGMRGHHGDGQAADTVATSGFLGWSMVHRSARPVGDADVGDPHWHVHVTVANMAKGTDDKWSTVAAGGRDLMRHAPAADQVLKALVRHDLATQFGVRFARSQRTGSWEVAAIPDETIRVFSKRGLSIEAMLTDLGFDPKTASRAAKEAAKRHTKQAKTEVTAEPDETLRSIWQREAQAHGFDPQQLADQALGQGDWRAKVPPPAAVVAEQIGASIVDPDTGVTGSMRRFTRVEALASVAEAMPQGAASLAEIEAVTDEVLARHGIVALDDDEAPEVVRGRGAGRRRQIGATHMRNAQRYTTRDVVDAEFAILTFAGQSLPGQGRAWVDPRTAALARSVTEAGQGFPLSGEQVAVFDAVVGSDQQLDAIIGPPGTGKTTLMRAVRAAYEAAGHRVAGAATAAVAAQNLASESGIASKTVEQWLWSIRASAEARDCAADGYRHPQQPGEMNEAQRATVDDLAAHGGLADVEVLVLDEANLTDDRDRVELYREAARTGTKVIEVGDPQQLRGVGCGSLFGRVHTVLDGHVLSDNRRQRDEDERAAIADWRDGHYTEALASWAGRGRLVATDTAEQATTAMVAEWMRQRHGAPDAHTEMRGLVMLAASNEAVDRLNEAAQAVRTATGELGRTVHYRVRGGRDVTVAEGDHVMIRINDRRERLHQGPDVLNGYRGVVEKIHRDRRVQVAWQIEGEDGPTLQRATLSPDYVASGGLSLGYAMTGHKAEGMTVAGEWDRPDGQHHGGAVLVAAAGMDEPGLHVATSRHRDRVVLFAGRDQVEDIATATSLGAPTSSAEQLLRVQEALARHARATNQTRNDTPVHDDLGADPAAAAKQQRISDELHKVMDELSRRQHRPPSQSDQQQPDPRGRRTDPVQPDPGLSYDR